MGARTFYGEDHGRAEIGLLYQFPPTVRLVCSERLEIKEKKAPQPQQDPNGYSSEQSTTTDEPWRKLEYKSLGHMHNDAEFGHQHGEINFWLPLTDCNLENTLWVESAPALRDWRPVLLEP